MEKIFERNLLYDFYGDLLTDRQKQIYEDSVFGDLSISELASDYDVSRQSIHDLIKRCDNILNGYEEKLHMIERFMKIRNAALKIKMLSEVSDSEALETINFMADEIIEIIKK